MNQGSRRTLPPRPVLDDVPESRILAVKGLPLLCIPMSKLERQVGCVYGTPLHPVAPGSFHVLRGMREPVILLVGNEGGRGTEPDGAQTTGPVAAGGLECTSPSEWEEDMGGGSRVSGAGDGLRAGIVAGNRSGCFSSVEAAWREETMRDRGCEEVASESWQRSTANQVSTWGRPGACLLADAAPSRGT